MLLIGLTVSATSLVNREPGYQSPIRIVLSSADAPGERLLMSTTASLYARNDPWKAFLAEESVCPGGERTDLPRAQQMATVACLVNYARQRRGLQRLTIGPFLNGASFKKANAIVRCENFAHNPCGGDWASAVRSTGYGGSFGENLYLASGPWGAPRVAVDAWLNSAPHRVNLFRADWRKQGLAMLPNVTFAGYRNVVVWVSELGSR